MRSLPVLVLIAAGGAASLSRPFRSPTSTGASYTIPWTDSTRRGDTIFYTKGRVVTTLAVYTDSQWTARPPVRQGLPSGPSSLPPDSLCTLGYTGTSLPVVGSTVLGRLDRIRECQGRTFAVIRRAKLKDSYGQLSVDATRAELDSWPWDGICARVADSTIIGFLVGDDVKAEEWGPAPMATRLAQWDSIGGLVRDRCPSAAVVLRALPTQMTARSNWQWVTTAWAQYTGPRRHGPPEQFFGAQVASAKRQHLGLVAGLNLLNGGCGATKFCLPDVPGTPSAGTKDKLYQMSAAEFTYYKKAAISDPYVCASVDWAWSPNFRSDFHEKPEIRTAAKALSILASERPLASCVQR
jgi:hypothetical protein